MKARIALVVALLVATIASVLVARVLGESVRGEGTTPVVVARADLPQGGRLTSAVLDVVAWPLQSLPAGVFDTAEALDGRVARWPINAGEPVLEARLAPTDATGGLSSTITPGKRAISVRVNDVVGVAGFALPGSFVDIVVSAKDAAGLAFSRIVLTRVRVLAAAQDTSIEPSKPKVVNAVTLELSPDEAEKLDLARNIGALSLVLRNEVDDAPIESRGARLSDLTASNATDRQPTQVRAAPSARPRQSASDIAAASRPQSGHVVQEFRGTQRTFIEFRSSERRAPPDSASAEPPPGGSVPSSVSHSGQDMQATQP